MKQRTMGAMVTRLLVVVAASAGWFVYFYAIDRLIMASQNLPLAWTLMPVS